MPRHHPSWLSSIRHRLALYLGRIASSRFFKINNPSSSTRITVPFILVVHIRIVPLRPASSHCTTTHPLVFSLLLHSQNFRVARPLCARMYHYRRCSRRPIYAHLYASFLPFSLCDTNPVRDMRVSTDQQVVRWSRWRRRLCGRAMVRWCRRSRGAGKTRMAALGRRRSEVREECGL
ncbi:hypothetical protein L226DRAFT_275675 [Lentinus tigrinus ALCF2SS1-7]|uniref:Uncharacterized protein n=1 Tax=Lentinus tigrinus ALCF2SS1-6 TaxID=1328759 RepID=A0A5C2SCM1_9APHY|nr:hypothetical protein L227DRAFT_70879 [Lentinus tigrinus ALCF2SS1-6]RPD69482.1 hypothetical protein L226DRAFT_275675 [Lentinus tigrinus ALCF2SS1-7]